MLNNLAIKYCLNYLLSSSIQNVDYPKITVAIVITSWNSPAAATYQHLSPGHLGHIFRPRPKRWTQAANNTQVTQ